VVEDGWRLKAEGEADVWPTRRRVEGEKQ